MNTLDQVLLLEQKVESAVEKIQQLQAENDALRKKCDELTNALSAKSEQLSSFETDSSRIETGIQKALDRLNSIEDSILKSEGQVQIPSNKSDAKSEVKSESKPETKSQTISNQNESYSNPTVQVVQDFNSMDNLEETSEDNNQNENQAEDSTAMDDSTDEPMEEPFAEEDNPQDEDLGFDIF
jgi:FtsZ-binding cell division protein ZapB